MLRVGVSVSSPLELPGLGVRMLLLGVDDMMGDMAETDAAVLSARLVVDSSAGPEVFELSEGEPCELVPGRWFVLRRYVEPLAFLDEVEPPTGR